MKKPVITVVGSINMDLVVTTEKRPVQGETIIGDHFQTIPGGKGANQAVAASRLGAEVHMIGSVGEDEFGRNLLTFLEKENIFLGGVEPVTDESSGVAVITLAEQDNSIVVVQAANKYVTPQYLQRFENRIANSDIVLAQLEIPLETVEEVAKLCHKHRTTFILNPAPAQALSPKLLEYAKYITPNETELHYLLSQGIVTMEQSPEKLIVTEGKDGIVYFDGKALKRVPGFSVTAVDTTGAGDTFNGAFAYAISQNDNVQAACQFANAAAALSVQQMGAQGGMPTKAEVIRFLYLQGKANVAEIY